MKSNGLVALYTFLQPSATSRRSATNSMYWHISSAFIPISFTGNESVTNSFSMVTALVIISVTCASGNLFFKCWLYNRQAKSQCKPSSREMSSFENDKPGISPRFFSQKMEQNEPEKKMPSTAAKAIRRSAKDPLEIQRKAHSAFFVTAGTVSIAWKRLSFSAG